MKQYINEVSMYPLPTTHEELTAWKLADPEYWNDEIQNSEYTWNWILNFGMPLFREHFKFVIETDMGLGTDTHVFYFCNKAILVSWRAYSHPEFQTIDKVMEQFGNYEVDRIII